MAGAGASGDQATARAAAADSGRSGSGTRAFSASGVSTPASLEAVREELGDCSRCRLAEGRRHIVFGTGSPEARLVFVGEAPGQDEDVQGEPFVGAAGQLLTRMIEAMGYTRQDVYIANMLKCRPPGNRDPEPSEMATCRPYLNEQIALIKPKVLCALGRVSGQALLETKTPLGKLRGEFHDFRGLPLLVTYHPAALLRFPAYKRGTWEDMQMLRGKYDELTG